MEKKKKAEPVICGIDIGSWTVKIACYDGEKFQILTNQANFRQTPSLVGYSQLERMIGEPANIKLKSNFMNTIRSPMRLLGLGKSPHLIQQQLKNTTVKYQVNEKVRFNVQHNQKQLILQPQQILMALMTKVKEIVSYHNLYIHACYIAVPSYLSNSQRSTVKKCAQITRLGQVNLVDDWIAISSQYSYFRIKQIKNSEKYVIFIDIGYSKFSIYACQFTPDQAILLDYQHLKYTGSRNMDHFLVQFYDDMFYNQTKTDRILNNKKAMTKLYENIEKQRKVLSANIEHHLNLQYLIGEEDLSYVMKRQQFQNIVMPVLSQISTALNNIKDRVCPKVKIDSIELIGGASRIPFIQQIVSNIFGFQPSKTLNASESMARGASIFGAIQTGFINQPYEISKNNFASICVSWGSVENQKYNGQNSKNYPNKKIVFDWGCKYPCEYVINLGNQKTVEMYIYYEHEIVSQSIGYLRVKTPNKVVFSLDKDRIISAKVLVGGFQIYNFHQLKQQKWDQMQKIQKELQQSDQQIVTAYNLKNQYESLIYSLRNKLDDEFKQLASKQQKNNMKEMLQQAEKWVQIQNQKQKLNKQDIKQYTQRIDTLNMFVNIIAERKKTYDLIQPQYQKFITNLQTKKKEIKTNNSKKQLENISTHIIQGYNKMANNLFESNQINIHDIRDAIRRISQLS